MVKQSAHNSLNRFSTRVANYVKYRPGYPNLLIDFFKQETILSDSSIVADIGSGTGLSAQLFVNNGNKIFGVEPNEEMRLAGENSFKNNSNFISINGTAEQTTLSNQSVDLIIAGQAFHWFDKEKCKTEFKRILKPGGTVALIWNDRRTEGCEFLKYYEEFIYRFATDYAEVNHKNIDETVFNTFFGKGNYQLKTFDNYQYFDFEGLKGRILSSSYMPDETSERFPDMIKALLELFETFNQNGKVTIEYDTTVYYGKLN